MFGSHQVKAMMENNSFKKTRPHRVIFIGTMNEVPMSFEEPKGDIERFLRHAE